MKRFAKQLVTFSALFANILLFQNCGGSGGFKQVSQIDGSNSQASTVIITSPSITQQPASMSVNQGMAATFLVVATGSDLVFQWYKNDVLIAGATKSVLVFSSVSSADAASYYVMVKNSVGNISSNQVSLSVNTAPGIAQQPQSTSATVGGSAAFTVAATGTSPLFYQWIKNGAAIANATNSSLNLTNLQAADAATYSVTITNVAGSVTSSGASLTVNPAQSAIAPAITTQPRSQSVLSGANITFSVVASGTAPISYQWAFNGVSISGATSSSYSIAGVTAAQAGAYSVVVSNTAGSIASSAANLVVNVAPSITTQPASQTVTAGANVTFSVTAAGTAPFTYQWKLGGSNISGATSASYTVSSATVAQSGGSYTVTVTNSVASVTSSAAKLTVNAAGSAPAITTQPVSQSIVTGGSVSFSVAAIGTGTLSYQWALNGSNISGATIATYTVSGATVAQSGGSYSVSVSNTFGTVASAAAILTVTSASGSSGCDYGSSSTLVAQITSTNLGLGNSGPTNAFNFQQYGNFIVQSNYDSPGYMPAGIKSTYSVWANGGSSCWGTSFVTGTFQGAPALGVPEVTRGWSMNASAMAALSPTNYDLWTTKSGMGVSVSTLNSKYNAASACTAGSAANSACMKWTFTAPGLGSGTLNTTTTSYSSWDVMADIYFHGTANPTAGTAPVLFDLQFYQAYMNDYVNGYLIQYNFPNPNTPPAFKTIGGVCYLISVNSWDPYTGASAGSANWGKDVGQAAVIPIANQSCASIQSTAQKLWIQVSAGMVWGMGSVKSDVGGIINWLSVPTTVNGVVGMYDDYGTAVIDNGTGKTLTQSLFAATVAKINTNTGSKYTDLYLTSVNAGVENYYTKDAANSSFVTSEFWFAMPGETVGN